jgi:hypothetical protein
MVNSRFAIWRKNGTTLVGPVAGPYEIETLFDQNEEVTSCDKSYGDPIVLCDEGASRWLLTQFAVPRSGDYYLCMAVSQEEDDPYSGRWWVYEFKVPSLPDYPKLGVWHNAYYVSTYEGKELGAYAFDRSSMLNGEEASYFRFTIPSLGQSGRTTTRILPSDYDGNPPPRDRPNWFIRSIESQLQDADPGNEDRIEIYEFAIEDFGQEDEFQGEATFEKVQTIMLDRPYAIDLCGPELPRNCIPQPEIDVGLDPLSNRLMSRLQYRNFGEYETLVAIQTVAVGEDDQAGIRWYELRKVGQESWRIARDGDVAPDGTNRWMGSAAMDGDGNIAVGYNVSSEEVFPGLRYTIIPAHRESLVAMEESLVAMETSADAAVPITTEHDQLQEQTIAVGGGSQSSESSRWGDYSAMSIDPADQCTFWYTGEYYRETTEGGWRTRIAPFKHPACAR